MKNIFMRFLFFFIYVVESVFLLFVVQVLMIYINLLFLWFQIFFFNYQL